MIPFIIRKKSNLLSLFSVTVPSIFISHVITSSYMLDPIYHPKLAALLATVSGMCADRGCASSQVTVVLVDWISVEATPATDLESLVSLCGYPNQVDHCQPLSTT